MSRFIVGRTDCTGEQNRFRTEQEAVDYINGLLMHDDPLGVDAGAYYIDDMQHPDAELEYVPHISVRNQLIGGAA